MANIKELSGAFIIPYYANEYEHRGRKKLLSKLPCISKARRFSYLVTEKAEQVKDQLLKEYRESHAGNLPACMGK